jgi:hypothetical protein
MPLVVEVPGHGDVLRPPGLISVAPRGTALCDGNSVVPWESGEDAPIPDSTWARASPFASIETAADRRSVAKRAAANFQHIGTSVCRPR